jgi:hypothetical protein
VLLPVRCRGEMGVRSVVRLQTVQTVRTRTDNGMRGLKEGRVWCGGGCCSRSVLIDQQLAITMPIAQAILKQPRRHTRLYKREFCAAYSPHSVPSSSGSHSSAFVWLESRKGELVGGWCRTGLEDICEWSERSGGSGWEYHRGMGDGSGER